MILWQRTKYHIKIKKKCFSVVMIMKKKTIKNTNVGQQTCLTLK